MTGHVVDEWPIVKRRWEAFWEHGLYDRPLVQVRAPREGVEPTPEVVDPETQWTDIDFMVRRTVEDLRTTYYGGEAIPWCWNPISAGYALLFGCRPHFSSATVYVDPAPEGEDGLPVLEGWRESPYWSWIRDGIQAFARASHGRFFVPVFWGNSAMDILGLVRGPEKFMLDIALNPEWVKSAVRQMNDILWEMFDELWQFTTPDVTGLEGCLETCGFWSPGRARTFDADMAYGISNEAFRELILPPMVEWMRTMDHCSWHLDGIGSVRHLDTLLALPEIEAIQWVQGEGPHKAIMQWVPLIRKIQSSGKSIQVICELHEVEPVLAEVSPEGLTISTRCGSEKEARELLERVDQLYR
jgi:hypothetical protein